LNKILRAGLLPGILLGAADMTYLWRTNPAAWDSVALFADAFLMCGGVLVGGFYLEILFPEYLAPTRGVSLVAGAIALVATPLTLWLAKWHTETDVFGLSWWRWPFVWLGAMYFVVALAQLTRRNGNLFRALLSLGIGFSSAVTLVPAIRMGQQVAAFLCFLGALTIAWNVWVFDHNWI
jgi:hypothetical protein